MLHMFFRIVEAVSSLRERVNNLRVLVDPLSVDDVWANPPPALGRASTNINRLVDEIDELLLYEVMHIDNVMYQGIFLYMKTLFPCVYDPVGDGRCH